MDLWIRSQDKKSFQKVDCMHIYENKGKFGISDYNISLGEYNTRERVIEIFDEIEELLKGQDVCIFYNCSLTREEWRAMKREKVGIVWDADKDRKSKVEYISPNIVVYDMPKE